MKSRIFLAASALTAAMFCVAQAEGKWQQFSNGKNASFTVNDGDSLKMDGKFHNSSGGFKLRQKLKPNTAYMLKFSALANTGSGAIISGTGFINKIFTQIGGNYVEHEVIFATSARPTTSEQTLHLGGWNTNSQIEFKNIRLREYIPLYSESAYELAPSESIHKGKYKYSSNWNIGFDISDKMKCGRNAHFNDNRWVVPEQCSLEFPFVAKGMKQLSATAEIVVCHNPAKLSLRVFASANGKDFEEIALLDANAFHKFKIAKKFFPTDKIVLKIVPEGKKYTALQINSVKYCAQLDAKNVNENVELLGAAQADIDDNISVDKNSLKASSREIVLQVESAKQSNCSVSAVFCDSKKKDSQFKADVKLESGTNSVRIPLPENLGIMEKIDIKVGQVNWNFSYASARNKCLLRYDPNGKTLVQTASGFSLWNTHTANKIDIACPPPPKTGKGIKIYAASNESECIQLILRSQKIDAKGSFELSDFTSGNGGKISSAQNAEFFKAHYVPIETPTDNLGKKGLWPDPLLRISNNSYVLKADTNFALWIKIKIPANSKGGNYKATLKIRLGKDAFDIPVNLRVFNFALPKISAVRSAFDASEKGLLPYFKEPQNARENVKKQLAQKLADARISPYNAIRPSYVFKFPDGNKTKTPQLIFDWQSFDTRVAEFIEKYNVNAIMLQLNGLGGGTFHSRTTAQFRGITENDPRYQSVLADYLGQIDKHIVEKNWQNLFYTYTFDEPEEKDYPFVKKELAKIKRYAPHIKTMLTEQPVGDLYGVVDIWCPVTPSHSPQDCRERIAKGEQIWWYICTFPRAPYAGPFIDHSGADLRTWLWQTFKYDVGGILIWSTTYMSSSTAYPDSLQNPYDDPMSWASGYGFPKGSKNDWGNGDGRFFYPPASLIEDVRAENDAEIVGTIRLEMIREGIEDYDYLALLKSLLKKYAKTLPAQKLAEYEKLLIVPDSISKSLTDFSFNTLYILRRRIKIAMAIEEIIKFGK